MKRVFQANEYGPPLVLEVLKESDGTVETTLNTATNLIMRLTYPPDDTSVEKTAEFYTDGTDGKIKYVFVDGDLTNAKAGTWLAQGGFTMSGTPRLTRVIKFQVLSSIVES